MLPSLFNVCMDAMMRKVTEETDCGIIAGSESMMDLDFTDEVALVADSWLVMVMRRVNDTQIF